MCVCARVCVCVCVCVCVYVCVCVCVIYGGWVWVDRGVCRGVGTHIRISKGAKGVL